MDLSGLRIHDTGGGAESLTLCVQAIARWGKLDLDYDDLNAALGLSLMISAPSGEASPAVWMAHGRDWNLVSAARQFGIALRDLHPPAAAAGLNSAEGFRQHFVDSYSPLVRQALEHQQPVLAWRGWPDALAWSWGIITGRCNEGIGFCGTVGGSGGQLVPMVDAAVQCYVAERFRPVTPSESDLLASMLEASRIVAHNRLDAALGVTTGSGVYDRWLTWLTQQLGGPAPARAAAHAHSRLAEQVASSRASAATFLLARRGAATGQMRAWLDELIERCQGVTRALTVSRDTAIVDMSLARETGVAALRAEVEGARRHDAAAWEIVDALTPRGG